MIGPSDAFVWGSGGAQLTPTQIDAQRKVAQALMAQGSDYSPVQSWTQGASRVAQAIFGGMQARDANEAVKANMAMEEKLIAPYLTGGAPQTATPSVSTPMGQTSIPSGSIDPRLSSAISTVASAHPDISPEYMTRLALVENGGKVEGGSPLSSAKGPFQFLDGTARQYGLGNPNDPNQSAEAAARLTLDNKAALTQALGREPTPGELYLAHQQGYGGAIKLLQHPDAPVESVIGAAAARNNAAAPGMTAGQFAGKWTGKFGDVVQTVDPAQKNIIDAQADDPAAIPVNAQPTQGFAIPGQAAPAVPMINPATLAKAAPYLSPFTQKFLGGVMTQQMERAQKQADPGYQLDLQLKQGQLSAAPLERRGKELANQKLERDLEGEGATPLTPEERTSFGIPQGQSAYKTRRGEIKFGPAGTNITTNVGAEAPDGQLRKKLDEQTAKNWGAWQEAGHVSAGQVQDLQMLDELVKVAPQGPITGRLAEAFPGVSSAGDAFNAIVKRVAPTMRAPGSGSTSDIEYDGMLRSLPALRNKPEANIAISEMMKAKSAVNIERADIISQYSQNQISRNDAEKRLGEINHRSIMTPAMRKMLGGLGGKGDVPLAGDESDGYRFKGGNPGDPSAWEKVQ